MPAPYFIFKGINSNTMNVVVGKLPDIEKAEANIEKIPIKGRSGFLTYTDGTYQGTVKPIECTLDNGSVEAIAAWLEGNGDLILSTEPNRVYDSTIINKIPFSKVLDTWQDFLVQFECQPFKKATTNGVITINASGGTVTSPGTGMADPIFKVFGSGTVIVTINGTAVQLNGLTDYLTIDSYAGECYHLITEPRNTSMIGDFPQLQPGVNTITWTGTVTKIEITPNWRYK